MASVIYEYLTDAEKNEIISSHIRSHEYTIYNLEISKLEAQAETIVDESTINSLNAKITETQAKISALKTKQSALTL